MNAWSTLVTAALLTAAVVPASGQTAGPANGGLQDAASIPDFSGIWAHLTFPDVEPPLSGAGPVRNLSRVTIEVARTLAPYNGATTVGASSNGVSNQSELVGDFTNPILKPEAAEVVKQHPCTRIPSLENFDRINRDVGSVAFL